MIDHLGLDVSDIARSRAFYNAALEPLGYRLIQEFPDGDATVVMYGIESPEFIIADKDRPGEANHIAFRTETRAQVDAFHAAALAAGGRDNGGPGLRPNYGPTYYAAFVHDPDGFNVEAVCHAAE
ncbi:VOC family protein [Brevundimonas lenta]|uniref:Catechol 2,3-dioxygenase-like lactoylglutathione lyase family enzyme n=1 Tax=Brevundimonas lenta TaxID=424796 RepID=A0A7W6JCY0_9CAUL|nr:VOC family protein [Brevundimonas lenta]MBB4081868.1 catechol 2,3-dioxygenase-like lactoylglutathione lyase family enzyme [Brevundimonas lenta]